MANAFLKAGVIARTAIGLLTRELVIGKTIWADAIDGAEFTGALNDTVTIRVPAIGAPARTRVLRAGSPIVNDAFTEFGIDVKLATDIYKGVGITDENLTLDIKDFGAQVLNPQTQAVAEKLEDLAAGEFAGASFPVGASLSIDEADPYLSFVDARQVLNDNKVPRASRVMLVGSSVEAAVLKSDRLTKFDQGPGLDAFTEATLGRMAGFTVVASTAIDPDEAYGYHRSALIVATRAPKIPEGVAMGEGISFQGFAMRWLMDYDYVNTTDRSLVNLWAGFKIVEDADDPTDPLSTTTLKRAVKLALAGS